VQRIVVRLAVAAFAFAAAGVVVASPAQASTCTTGHGVSVVVDFNQLGGGVQTACDVSGAGRTASTQLTDVGHSLTYVQRQPGFVCRIDGLPKPSSDACVVTPPADAYWSLWWSDGKSGTWTYASSGTAGLKVPDGGYVGLSWQQGSAKAPPGVAPQAHASSPSSQPTSHPTSSAPPSAPRTQGSSPTTAPGSASTSVAPTGSPSSAGPGKQEPGTKKSGGTHHHAPSTDAASPAAKGTDGAVPTEAGGPLDPASEATDDGDLPGWVAPVAVLALFAAAGTVVVVRRRGSGGA
jgi:hypothetical protein